MFHTVKKKNQILEYFCFCLSIIEDQADIPIGKLQNLKCL